ncbi:adenylate/guanylate cyclase domain-containing protein [Dolichospermum sp. ST_con]|nr:adenylate/guanylate cyclase domain-containing protein [Dolichospermum sp. ST_con]MDD1418728.1 adenylate/guanylate cyclase domain-containing protein [Dolichospermum sp. ST_sed1]MDD1423247.1 adenylate/guanylate cyclase domain-containing protein [Dolichospermum sp. ST_sed9]MDD1430949.1 adenylate/guanylate cyclase domain-containing protein [Dolichospermum sp. ST_sed6]MDD1438804.1 adenylate/guanylate cyclase domain-containing protein [Dolichospermum sp. ST_sed3]MDD1444707.1 adenylate/guanylate c
MLKPIEMCLKLFQSKLSRYIVTWVFTSIVVIEIAILIPSYFRRQDELLSNLENVSNEVFSSLVYRIQQGANSQEILDLTSRKLKPGSVILGGAIYQTNGQLVGTFGEKPSILYNYLSEPKMIRVQVQNGTRYDVAWTASMLAEKYVLIIRHNSVAVKEELFAFSLRIAGLIFIISVFVTLTTTLTLGVTVIRPILQLRDDLIIAGEAITNDSNDPIFSTMSKKRQDEMGEVILAFYQMFARVRQEIYERQQVEICLRHEQEKSEQLLLNILPAEIAQQLKQQQSAIANRFDEVTILFADIVNFTELAAQISPIELVNSLNQIFSCFDRLAQTYGLEKIKTIGDAYMVVGGLPNPHPDHAVAVAKMALDMQQEITKFKTATGENFQIRIGMNTGSVVAGVIGLKKFSYDLWGDAVNLASRMESHGIPGKIQVSEVTYLLIKDEFQLEERGIIKVKGRGELTTYFLIA